jgi:hypothetical protein
MSDAEYFDQPQSMNLGDGQLEDLLQQADLGGDDSPGDSLAAAKERLTGAIPGGGELLEEEDEKKVFKAIEKDVKRTARIRTNRYNAAKHWGYVRDGCTFSTLEKSEDQSVWKQNFPLDVETAPQPVPNKIGDTCNKMRNQVLIDVPLPKPIPDGDDDRSRMAVDVAKKFLRANATPDALNDADLFHSVFDLFMTQRSSFVYVWVDPMGAGWKPKQIKAHPLAEDPKNPFVGPKIGDDNKPVVIQTQQGPVPITERTTDPILRYVAEDEQGNQTFTKNPSEAARQWMPAERRKILYASQVQTHPHTADVFTARHLTLLMWETLGEAKQRFELLNEMSEDQIRLLVKWKPEKWEQLVPESLRPKKGGEVAENGEVHDGMILFWYHRFCRSDQAYMDGGEIAVNGAGGGTILFRDTLRDDVELDDGTTVPIVRRPPVSQFKGLNDVVGGDPYGLEPISLFGGANEVHAHLWLGLLEVMHKGLNPNTYIPSTSPITKEEFNRRDGEPLTILVPEDKPVTEEPPHSPPEMLGIIDRIDHAINSLAGTNETTNGLDSSYAVSGEAKKVAINQAKVGLKQIWHNMVNGACYYWLICTELAQAKLTVPQQLQLAGGVDSAYKQRYFVGADLVGITKIAVEPGSASMMSATEKAQWLGLLQGQGWISKDQAAELARASLSDDLGIAPSPHEEAINREIADWVDGPPDGWEDDYAANMQLKQQYEATMQQTVASIASTGLDPRSAQQQALQKIPPPQFKPLYSPFTARPNDEDPAVALIKAQKLSRFMSSADYRAATPAWRAIYDDAYRTMFYNAGGQTVKQQAAAAQAQSGQGAQGAGGAGSDDITFAQFVKAIEMKVIAAVESQIAKGIGPGGAPPETGQNDAQVATIEALAKNADADAGRAHDAREAQLERAHQAAENAHDRAHEMKKAAITETAKAVDRTHQQVQRAALQPRPAPNVSADPAQDPNPSPIPQV